MESSKINLISTRSEQLQKEVQEIHGFENLIMHPDCVLLNMGKEGIWLVDKKFSLFPKCLDTAILLVKNLGGIDAAKELERLEHLKSEL